MFFSNETKTYLVGFNSRQVYSTTLYLRYEISLSIYAIHHSISILLRKTKASLSLFPLKEHRAIKVANARYGAKIKKLLTK